MCDQPFNRELEDEHTEGSGMLLAWSADQTKEMEQCLIC